MKKNKTTSTLIAALFFAMILSITSLAVETDNHTREQADNIETTRAIAVSADFEYCPDGTIVESLEDCSDIKDDATIRADENEYDIVTNLDEIKSSAKITTKTGKTYYVDVKINQKMLDKASPALAKTVCSVSQDNEIVCKVTHLESDDEGKLYCWGRNNLRECPNENTRIATEDGGAAGKVSISDIKINTETKTQEDEIEIYTWSWGTTSLTETTDPDNDELTLSYVWSIENKLNNESTDESKSNTKIIEWTFENNQSTTNIEIENKRLQEQTLVFTTIVFDEFAKTESEERCEITQLLNGDDCDDDNPTRRPQRTNTNNDSAPDFIDVDDDGDGILTRAKNNTNAKPLDKASPILFSIEENDFDEENKDEIRDYLSNLSEIKGRDFGLFVALSASENPRVREVRYNNDTNTVEIDHDEEVRLLGFIKMNTRARTTINEEGQEETKFPWWAALATKSEKPKFKAGAELSKSVN